MAIVVVEILSLENKREPQKQFDIRQFVKTGAEVNVIVKQLKNDKLSSDEFIVLIVGANNAYNNNTETIY